MSGPFSLRRATKADIPTLVRHRRWMFEDMSLKEGRTFAATDLDTMENRYADHLRRHLDSELTAWIAEVEGSVAGSGVVAFLMWPPGPFNPLEQIGHVHSLYTLPEARRRGVARAILASAIEFSRVKGLRWITLQASDEGRSLYESFGFTVARDEMRLGLPVETTGDRR